MIPADKWPEHAVALVFDCRTGGGQWLTSDSNYIGHWRLASANVVIPPGHDWRVPVMRHPQVDLRQFRNAVAYHLADAEQSSEVEDGERLLALIDGQKGVE